GADSGLERLVQACAGGAAPSSLFRCCAFPNLRVSCLVQIDPFSAPSQIHTSVRKLTCCPRSASQTRRSSKDIGSRFAASGISSLSLSAIDHLLLSTPKSSY